MCARQGVPLALSPGLCYLCVRESVYKVTFVCNGSRRVLGRSCSTALPEQDNSAQLCSDTSSKPISRRVSQKPPWGSWQAGAKGSRWLKVERAFQISTEKEQASPKVSEEVTSPHPALSPCCLNGPLDSDFSCQVSVFDGRAQLCCPPEVIWGAEQRHGEEASLCELCKIPVVN